MDWERAREHTHRARSARAGQDGVGARANEIIVVAVSLPSVVFTFESGARVSVHPNDAAWLRDELLRGGTFGTPRHSMGVTVDECLRRLGRGEDALPITLEGGQRAAVAWAVEQMLAADSARLRASLGLMHLRDLLVTEN
jgi:hypothetical protein